MKNHWHANLKAGLVQDKDGYESLPAQWGNSPRPGSTLQVASIHLQMLLLITGHHPCLFEALL